MHTLSKAKLRLFRSLHAKKKRYKEGLFLVEGEKVVFEALTSPLDPMGVILRTDVVPLYEDRLSTLTSCPVWEVSDQEFSQLTTLENSEGIVGVLPLLEEKEVSDLPPGRGIVLDGLQDPGNVGTIFRIADWFGLPQILLTTGTVDIHNPKTVRASMGAIFRVSIGTIKNKVKLLESQAHRVWVADMVGESLPSISFSGEDYLWLGNESNGIDPIFDTLAEVKRVHIPGGGKAESLNVSIAAGILVYEMIKNTKGTHEKRT